MFTAICGMDEIRLDGWLSKVKGSLRALSVLIMLLQVQNDLSMADMSAAG